MNAPDSQKRHEIHHAATGGTIDSHWDGTKDTAVPNDQTIIPGYLDHVRLPMHTTTAETLILKDSRDIGIQEQDRAAARIAESHHRNVLGTSGTYLMPDIATAVLKHPAANRFKSMGKKVVMTGSGVPMDGYLRSDGGFSLGMGTAVLQEDTDAPVMLTMNGLVLDVRKGVRKDLTRASFSSAERVHDILGYDDFTLVPIGGSIDFELDGLDGIVPAKDSIIPSYLRDDVQLQRDFHAINPYVKDSRDLNDADIDLVAEIIRESTSENVLITLGIYEMRRVQAMLRAKLGKALEERRVLMTGSRYPLAVTDRSDAPFNLGYSLGKMASAPHGVNIALNGFMAEEDDDLISLIYTEQERVKLQKAGVIE
jgi:L-asparaginase